MKTLCSILFFSLALASCSKNSLSDRDARLSQIRNSAELKRRELALVAGDYSGKFSQPSKEDHAVTLRLEIKDIPTIVEGFVDPVLIPTLSGYFRFTFGINEYEGFPLIKAEFDALNGTLNMVGENPKYKQIKLGFTRNNEELTGKWLSDSFGVSGDGYLKRGVGSAAQTSLRGTYQGKLTVMNPQANLPERALISIVTSQDAEGGMRITGNLRLYLGPFDSFEYIELPFETSHYNVFTRILYIRTTRTEIEPLTVKATIESGLLKGTMDSDALGEVANLELVKQ